MFEEPLASAPRLLKAAAPGELWGTRASLTRSLPSTPKGVHGCRFAWFQRSVRFSACGGPNIPNRSSLLLLLLIASLLSRSVRALSFPLIYSLQTLGVRPLFHGPEQAAS